MSVERQDLVLPLNSDRLLIRQIINSDLDSLYELLSNEEVMHYSAYGPYSMQETKEWLTFIIDYYTYNNIAMYAVELKSSKKLIGICGIMPVDNQLYKYEIGFRILPAFQGNGYATEAAVTIRDYACKINISKFVAFIVKENVSSIRVAEKIAMTFLKNDVYKNIPVLVYQYDCSN